MKFDDFRQGKVPKSTTTTVKMEPIPEAIATPESEAAWAELQQRLRKKVSLSGLNPLHNSVAAAEMARVFHTIRVGDVIQFGNKEIVVTDRMWKDAKHCIRELVDYQCVNWIFPNIPDDTLGASITRMYLATNFWRFYVDYLSDEPSGLGLFARLKYRFWSS